MSSNRRNKVADDELVAPGHPTKIEPLPRWQAYLDPLRFLFSCALLLPSTVKEVYQKTGLFSLLNIFKWRHVWFAKVWALMTAQGEDYEWERYWIFKNAKGVVVEIGPGNGSSVRWYPSPDSKRISFIHAVEPNESFHEPLRRNFEKFGWVEGENFEIIACGLEDLSKHIKNDSIDTVISLQALCCIRKPQQTIRQMYKMLKSGGQWRGLEHTISPDFLTKIVQHLLSPIWQIPAAGCKLTRHTKEWLTAADGKGKDGWKLIELMPIEGTSKYAIIQNFYGRMIKA